MAIARSEKQITWSSSNSVSVSGSGNSTSDAEAIAAAAIGLTVQLKADHSGTPGADDYVDFYLLSTLGDPDGASTSEFTTTGAGHRQFLYRLDTNVDDPAISPHLPISVPVLEVKIYAVNNAGESVTVSATLLETTG